MADINQVITLGIGTPGDIEHFILVGLNGAPETTPTVPTVVMASNLRAMNPEYRDLNPSYRGMNPEYADRNTQYGGKGVEYRAR